MRGAGALRHLACIDHRQGKRTCARRTCRATACSSKIGTSAAARRRFPPGIRGRAASISIFAALDPAGRQLDQVALAEREMRAEPELADQHDFVALKIDRQITTTTRPTRTTSRSTTSAPSSVHDR